MVSAFVMAGCKNTQSSSQYEVLTIEELQAETSVDITFRIQFGKAIQDVILELIESFNEEYPNVNITLDIVNGSYTEMKKATVNDISGGLAPTMSVGYPDHFAEYLITDSIISLNGFMDATDPRIGYTQAEIDDFLEGYVAENTMFDLDGSFKGLPFNKSTEVMVYNKDFFDHFELTPPTTWAELETLSTTIYDIVDDLTDKQYAWLGDIATNLAASEFLPLMYDSTGNLFTTIIHQFDGKYTGALYRGDSGVVDVQRGTLDFATDEKASQALTYLQGLAEDNVMNVPEVWEGLYGSNFFINGKILMNVGSTGGISHYADSISSWNAAPIPYKDADHKYVIQQGTNFTIFSQASDMQKLAAWLFIKHCLTPENTAMFAMKTGYLPVRHSAYELEIYESFLNNPTPAQSDFSKVHNATLEYSGNGWNYFVDAAWAGSSGVRDEVGTALAQILVLKTSVATALADAVSRIG